MSSCLSNTCWNQAGVWGDKTCLRLGEYIHCHNCPAFAEGARILFDRELPEGYRQEWTELLSAEQSTEAAFDGSLAVFRIGPEWLALPAGMLAEVVTVRPIRRIPHRAEGLLLGLVSIRGAINLCVSLRKLLGIEGKEPESAETGKATPRLIVLCYRRRYWVFPADEVVGLFRYRESDVQALPASVAKSIPCFSRGLIDVGGRMVGLLKESDLIRAFERALA